MNNDYDMKVCEDVKMGSVESELGCYHDHLCEFDVLLERLRTAVDKVSRVEPATECVAPIGYERDTRIATEIAERNDRFGSMNAELKNIISLIDI